MKRIILTALVAMSALALSAESYTVATVIGKVSCEKSGKWKTVKVGEELADDLNLKIEESSSITLNVKEKRVTLRGPLTDVLGDLISEKNAVKKTPIKKTVLKGTTVSASKKSTKGVATASSRASEAQGSALLDEE